MYHHIHLRSLIISCLSIGDICLFLSISSSFVTGLFCGEAFETLLILSAISFSIKSPEV